EPVTFSVSGLPSGVTATFNPASVTTSGSSTMTVTSGAATPTGSFLLTITGTSGSLIHAVPVTLVETGRVPLAVDRVISSDGAGTRITPSFSTSAAPETLLAFAAADGPASGGQAFTVDPTQTMVHQWVDSATGDTYWVQAVTGPVAAAGTSVQLRDVAPTTDRWNFAAVEIKAANAPLVAVPDVVNLTQSAAIAALTGAGLTVG